MGKNQLHFDHKPPGRRAMQMLPDARQFLPHDVQIPNISKLGCYICLLFGCTLSLNGQFGQAASRMN
jgi:hypothetical protein